MVRIVSLKELDGAIEADRDLDGWPYEGLPSCLSDEGHQEAVYLLEEYQPKRIEGGIAYNDEV